MTISQEVLASTVGTDNVSPVHNPTGRWQIWNMDDMYLGTVGAGKYIPKIKDEVHEHVGDTITRYIVVDINAVTLVPVFHQENSSTVTQPLSEEDVLLGVGPGTPSDTYRVYIDRSVMPYRAAIDARCHVYGTATTSCKLFKGANISDSGIVISGVYNQNGQLVSENIPLELVAEPFANNVVNVGGPTHTTAMFTNHAVKACVPFHTTATLVNGELVTAVFYDAVGFVVSKRQLLVENTAFIRSSDANRRYVIGISLETPFLSAAGSRVISYPLNVPLNALNLVGVVHYNDGSSNRLAVDGTRFSVAGLDAYAATIVGQRNRLVLKYTLGATEIAYGSYSSVDRHISEIYEIVTANMNGTYAVQLYAWPVWVDAVNGYRLEWFLYDLDRSIRYNVTPSVRINTAYGNYDSKLYGVNQTLSVSINLKDVNGTYTNFIHVQFMRFLLNKPGTGRPLLDNLPNWNVSTVAGQEQPYGLDAYATYIRLTVNAWKLRLAGPNTTKAAWLDKVYWPTVPLHDSYREVAAPLPTHFTLVAGTTTVDYSIDQWGDDLMLNQALTNNSTVYLKFFKRTVDNDLQLSIAAMPLYQVDSNGNYV